MKNLVAKLIELIKKYMKHERSIKIFCLSIQKMINNLIEFGCIDESDTNLIIDLLDICFGLGWFEILKQDNPLLIKLGAYLGKDMIGKNEFLLCNNSENRSEFQTNTIAFVPTLEFPAGIKCTTFLRDLDNRSKLPPPKDPYVPYQSKSSLFMTLIIKNILKLFVMLKRDKQRYALDYVRKLVSIELKNDKSPIIVHSFALLELCEWYYNCSLERSTSSEGEHKGGELWCLNE